MGFFVLFIDLFLFLTRGRWVEEMLLLFFVHCFYQFYRRVWRHKAKNE